MESVWLQPLTDEEMSAKGLGHDLVWMIKHGEDIYGPYEAHALRAHALKHVEFYSQLQASIVANVDWVPFFEAKPFRSRSPQLVSNATLQAPERFWVVHRGLRQGPYSQADLQHLINDGDVWSQDSVSYDDGESWQQVSAVSYFTHLTHSADALPQAPDAFLEAHPGHSVDEAHALADPVREGMASLAYLGAPKTSLFTLDEIILAKGQPFQLPTDSAVAKAGWMAKVDRRMVAIASSCAAALVVAILVWPSAETTDGDLVADGDVSGQVEFVPSGSSLLEADQPQRRMPASRANYQEQERSVPSPRVMRHSPRRVTRYQESHGAGVEPPEEVEPPEVGLYPEETPDSVAEAAPAEEGGPANREPSSSQTPPDDGYRLEGSEEPVIPVPEGNVETPVIEEVGDF